MKKLLALVLALVMTLGLATVGANAALSDFKDADSITNEEAMAVMNAVGVFEGSDGILNPTGKLTRAEASKLVAYLALGKSVADALPKTGSQFADVANNQWYTGYVNYMVNAKYTSGISATQFGPAGALTGYQFGAFLLAALGYNRQDEGMVGDGWETKVAVLLERLGLTDDVKAFGSEAITREEAAQMCLNALKADVVEYDGTSSVINLPGGASITTAPSKAKSIVDTKYDAKKDDASGLTDGTLQLAEKLYGGKLKLVDTGAGDDDEFGRPAEAKKWEYKDKDVYVGIKSANYTATVTSKTDAPAAKTPAEQKSALAKVLGLKENQLKAVDKVDDKDDGYSKTVINGTALTKWTDSALKVGDEVEVYVDSNKKITNVIITRYEVAKITKVADLTAKQIKALEDTDDADATKNITFEVAGAKGSVPTGPIYDTRFAGFDYEKDDFVMVVLKGKEVIASKAAETVEGKVDATKSGTGRIGGTFYAAATNYVGDAQPSVAVLGEEGTWVLDAEGNVAAFVGEAAISSAPYIYIYSISKSDGSTNSDGISSSSDTYTAYGVADDGTKVKYELATVKSDDLVYIKGAKGEATYRLTTIAPKAGANVLASPLFFAYKLSDNKLERVKVASDTIVDTAKSTFNKSTAASNNVIANDNTKFVFVKVDSSVTVKTATGYKDVNIADQHTYAVTNSKKVASVVFVNGAYTAPSTSSSAATIAVKLADEPTVTGTDDKPVYTFTFSVNGAALDVTDKDGEIKVDAKDNNFGTVEPGDVFTYTIESDEIVAVVKDKVVKDTVAYASDSQLITTLGATIDLGAVDKQYTITIEGDDVTVDTGATFSAEAGEDGNKIAYVKGDNNTILAVFAYKYVED